MQSGVLALDKAVKRLMELDQCSVFALVDIAEERVRQVESEGWTPEHDDHHTHREMLRAAAAYAIATPNQLSMDNDTARRIWPWDARWWKPKSPHRNQVRAGALIVAELARWMRTAPAATRDR